MVVYATVLLNNWCSRREAVVDCCLQLNQAVASLLLSYWYTRNRIPTSISVLPVEPERECTAVANRVAYRSNSTSLGRSREQWRAEHSSPLVLVC